jgi:streptogramin lyase
VWNNVGAWGPYGGAVDKNHDFWVTGWHGPLVRINAADYTYDVWNDPILANVSAYGFALDREGDPWFGGCSGSVVTFNTQTEQFLNVGTPGGCLRGLQVDAENRGWIARNGGSCLIQVDTLNNTIVNQNINLPGCQTVVGVSIDIEGFVWVVDQGGRAFKVDPDTLQSQVVQGFSSPYTYSDMTGAGIRLQAMPQ